MEEMMIALKAEVIKRGSMRLHDAVHFLALTFDAFGVVNGDIVSGWQIDGLTFDGNTFAVMAEPVEGNEEI